jgi:hypothetical protein
MNGRIALAVAACASLLAGAAQGDNGGLAIEAGSAMLFGKFTYEDATVDISEEFFNPRISAEYIFPNSAVSIGLLYAMTENTYTLEFDDGEKILDGSLDIERTDLIPFLRLGSINGTNLRLGYRMFNYKLSNGELDETRGGSLTRMIREGEAEGDLSAGIDAEFNLVFGSTFKAGLMIGGTYFMDAEYDWTYRDSLNGGTVESGSATLDAVSLRLAPEMSYEIATDLRLFINYTVAATAWIGNKDDEEEEYAGYDVVSALTAGLRYNFGL